MENTISVSISDAQNILGIKKTKIYELLKSGEIPAKKLGKRTLLLRSDLENFIQNLDAYQSENGGENV